MGDIAAKALGRRRVRRRRNRRDGRRGLLNGVTPAATATAGGGMNALISDMKPIAGNSLTPG